jgi:hypothetical protein
MKRRWTYNAAGVPEEHEYDRDGSGYAVAVSGATYNARGQLTGSSMSVERTIVNYLRIAREDLAGASLLADATSPRRRLPDRR